MSSTMSCVSEPSGSEDTSLDEGTKRSSEVDNDNITNLQTNFAYGRMWKANFYNIRLERCRQDIQTTSAVFYLSSSERSVRLSVYSRPRVFPVSGDPPRRTCAVTRGFQTTTQDLSVFPFLPRHYHMTRVLLLPLITTVWILVVLAIINIIQATLKCL